ncbi:hypothetical protein ICN30_06295 [Polynucleobacter sp. 31A-FELB]|uniref:hypothetical protein n=1 Tax=Polynucleobacter sp. 31A-FELB TaxID=2689096 RepID=UPI001C0AF5CA|nr:hypothetical protein [Polynucleobacter sp. 31A-FELB]MBU3587438.1 hypothetical protein [Polynucleobacter sp. 31A-FELB]
MNQEICQPESQDFSPEEQAFMEKEYANQPRIEDAERCHLPPSGASNTLSPVYDWAKTVVALLQKQSNGQRVKARLWAYRYSGAEWLVMEFLDGAEGSFTFCIGEPHNYVVDDSSGTVTLVPDMTEALHMAGIVFNAVNAEVEVGNRRELNPCCCPDKTTSALKVESQKTGEDLAK